MVLTAMAVGALLVASAGSGNPPGVLESIRYHTEDRLIYLTVRINDSAPLTFVLDSGARHTIVDSSTAVALGLRRRSADRVQGVGAGSVPLQHVAPVELQVGLVPLHVDDPWVIDFRTVGREQGLLGADFLERYVVRIDPVRETLTVMDTASFRPEGAGTPLPLTLDERDHLYVDMRLTLSPGVSEVRRMRLDTGSGDAASDNLVRRSSERRKSVQGVGLGVPYVDYSGVFQSVSLAPYTIHHVWGPSNDHPAVGMEILRRFTMTFDVPHRRLYLLPNHHLHDPVPEPAATR